MRGKSLSLLLLIVFALFVTPGLAQTDTATPSPAEEAATTSPPTGLITHTEGAFDGYTLFVPLDATTIYLINMDGDVVHSWEMSEGPAQEIYLLENGNLLYTTIAQTDFVEGTLQAGGVAGTIHEITWDGEEVWSYTYADLEHVQHHDLKLLPNGNIIFIAWEAISLEDELVAGLRPELLPPNGVTWADEIVEVDPSTDEIIWRWRTWDHLIQDYSPNLPNYGIVSQHPERVNVNNVGQRFNSDWQHLNAIDYNPELDQILVSVHNLSEIWVIDHSTTTEEAAVSTGGNSGHGGDLLYRWGNPSQYNQGDPSDRQLFLQHDAQWIRPGLPGAGNITIFNNGDVDHNRPYSTVMEITPPLNEDGTYAITDERYGPGALDDLRYGPTEPTWEYVADPPESFFAALISSAQRLPNGNTLICECTKGHMFEVTTDGDIVWEYTSPYNGNLQGIPYFEPNAIFRIERYAPDYSGFEGHDLTPEGS